MFVVVDANVVLSALLTKGRSFDVFAINKLKHFWSNFFEKFVSVV